MPFMFCIAVALQNIFSFIHISDDITISYNFYFYGQGDLEETISDNYVSEMSRFLTEFNTSESRNLEKKITKKEH
jgi:hypothetical protein